MPGFLNLSAHRHTHFSCLSLCAQVTITDYMLSFLLSSKENRIHKGQYVTKSFWLSQTSNTLLINMNVKLHSSIDLTAKTYQKKYYLTIDQHVTVFQACVILLMSVFWRMSKHFFLNIFSFSWSKEKVKFYDSFLSRKEFCSIKLMLDFHILIFINQLFISSNAVHIWL